MRDNGPDQCLETPDNVDNVAALSPLSPQSPLHREMLLELTGGVITSAVLTPMSPTLSLQWSAACVPAPEPAPGHTSKHCQLLAAHICKFATSTLNIEEREVATVQILVIHLHTSQHQMSCPALEFDFEYLMAKNVETEIEKQTLTLLIFLKVLPK